MTLVCLLSFKSPCNNVWYILGPKLRYRTIDIFKDVLETITPETILQKQRAIERVAPSLQYSVPPVERLRDRSDTAPWSSPVRDAVDVFIDAMSRRAAFRREGQFTAEPEFAEPAYIMEAKAWNVRYKDIFA